jgi:hypothetical protein
LQEEGRIHPFWLSHEENRAWLRLSMGAAIAGVRAPWPTMGSSPERERKGKRVEGQGAHGGFGRGGRGRHGGATTGAELGPMLGSSLLPS